MAVIKYNPLFGQPEDGMAQLKLLSSFWKKRQKLITIVVAGLGNVFWEKYWPPLRRLSAQPGRAHIWLVDINPLTIEHLNEIKNYPNVHFLNKSVQADLQLYEKITSDTVLISVPDAVHLKTTEEWLGENWWKNRASIIFIEKPYDQDVGYAKNFQNTFVEKLHELPCVVIPFDHYLAKITDFALHGERCLQELGEERWQGIEFKLLEKDGIGGRGDSLRYGMIYDLFCHILAVLSIVCNLNNALVLEVDSAKYEGAPMAVSDTYAHIKISAEDFQGRIVYIEGDVGKGIGKQNEKYINIVGETSSISFDFSDSKPTVRLVSKNYIRDVFRIENNAYDSFIERLFEGDYIDFPAGALTNATAYNILQILSAAKNKASYAPKIYKFGDSLDTIKALPSEEK